MPLCSFALVLFCAVFSIDMERLRRSIQLIVDSPKRSCGGPAATVREHGGKKKR
jgi:hypothetical protein